MRPIAQGRLPREFPKSHEVRESGEKMLCITVPRSRTARELRFNNKAQHV